MTTIVNNPAPNTESGGSGFLIGVIVLVALVAVLLYFGIPALNRMGPVQVEVPAPEVVVPGEINVNVSKPE